MRPHLAAFGLGGLLAAMMLLVACRPPVISDSLATVNQPAVSASLAQNKQVDLSTGTIRVGVIWPKRGLQAVPPDTARIDLAIFRLGSQFPFQAPVTLQRPVGGTIATTKDFTSVPSGEYLVRATAKDEFNRDLAVGAVAVLVRPNEMVQAGLVLQPVNAPVISGFTPDNGFPGSVIYVYGSGFGRSAGFPISARIGAATADILAEYRSQAWNDGGLWIRIPLAAGNGRIAFAVGDKGATSSFTLAVIATVSLTPISTTTFSPGGTIDFVAVVKDSAGESLSLPNLDWRISAKTGCGGCTNADKILGDGSAVTFVTGRDPGQIVVSIGTGSMTLNAAVDVHELGLADLKAWGLGPAPSGAKAGDTQARVNLGRTLFNDPYLSRKGDMSCATCHDPNKVFGDGRRFALGNDGQDLPRHAPTILDAAFQTTFFWDGRAASLEDQVMGVVNGPREFNSDLATLSAYLNSTYDASFQSAYQGTASVDLMAKAIAVYERTLTSPPTSAFDKYLAGDQNALSPAAKRGLGIFVGQGRCVVCHSGPALSDGLFHNVAVQGSGTLDLGRMAVTNLESDRGRFKTPTLRNVALTAPYFHDGSAASLDAATHHYETFRRTFPNVSPIMKKIFMPGLESADVIEFQKALTATPSI